MKHIDIEQAVATATQIPAKMTRAEKLLHWARLVREYKGPLALYHLLEKAHPKQLAMSNVERDNTAMGVAARDSMLFAQGLTDRSIAGIMGFFQLSQHELHEFSCDCGGVISNGQQADRIERLIPGMSGGGWIGRMARGFR